MANFVDLFPIRRRCGHRPTDDDMHPREASAEIRGRSPRRRYVRQGKLRHPWNGFTQLKKDSLTQLAGLHGRELTVDGDIQIVGRSAPGELHPARSIDEQAGR